MRRWDLRHKDVGFIIADKPIEEQSRKILIEIIYDLQAIIERHIAEKDMLLSQQDKFLAVLKDKQ